MPEGRSGNPSALEGEGRPETPGSAQSEARLRALFEASRDAVSLSRGGFHLMVNPALVSMFAYADASQLVGESVLGIIASPERARVAEFVRCRLSGEPAPPDYETRGLRKDQTEIDIEVKVSMPLVGHEKLTLAIIRDITERKRIEREASDWRRRYDLVAAASGQVVYEYTTADGAIAWSGSIESVFGYTLAQMQGGVEQWGDLVHPDDRELALRLLEASESQGGNYAAEYRFRHKSGHYVPILDQGVALLDSNGATERVVGVMRDLSEAKRAAERDRRAAEALRVSEELYRTLVTASPDAILILDGEGRLCYVSPKALEMARAESEAELVGRSIFEWIAPEDQQRVSRDFAFVLSGKELPGTRYRLIRRAAASAYWAEVGAAPLQDAAGEVNGMIVVARDVSAAFAAEEDLRRVAAFNEAVLATLDALVVVLDREGYIVQFNGACERLTGWRSEDVLGRRCFDLLVPEEDRPGVNEAFQRLQEANLPNRHENAWLTRSGERRWIVWANSALLDEDGNVEHVIGTGIDITQRRDAELDRERLQAQLIELQKMDAVGRLAGGIAHDFNNLLTAVLGHADLALAEVDAAAPIAENLAGITAVVEQARGLTQQILAFGRRQVLRMVDVDLNREVSEAVRMLRRVIPESIDIHTHLAPELLQVRADLSQLRQVLLNLVINGRDAMQAGGFLALRTSQRTVTEEDTRALPEARVGEYVCLEVADTGTGMDEATALRVFEPFFTTKKMGQGTGLGLATVYGIVRQHGGFVRVESALGDGSTFTVFLPAAEGRSAAPAPQSRPIASRRGSETLLVVEDEPLVREPLVRQLAAAGYEVLAAEGPMQALQIARHYAGPIRLLLTDVVMPGMDGAALHVRLSEERPGLPVLFMSGYSGDVLVREGGALREGLNFIQKPFGVEDLTQRIRDILDGPLVAS